MEDKLRILLCEDDENLGTLTREYLEDKGFKAVVVLPKGTNYDLTFKPESTKEDKLLTAVNKWLIAHEDAKIDGAFNGLVGENITIA